jgi:hypothetical protein
LLHNRQQKCTKHIQAASTLAQQPSNKGRKCVIFCEPDHATTPAAYALNLNTSQQEMLRLNETYAHTDIKEIQQQIKNCESKAKRQVATCHIPNVSHAPKTKGKRDHINNTAGPSHKMITTRGQTHR